MTPQLITLIAQLGIDAVLILLKNLQGVTTLADAIAALEKTKTAQEYVDADAARRNVPSVPLPT